MWNKVKTFTTISLTPYKYTNHSWLPIMSALTKFVYESDLASCYVCARLLQADLEFCIKFNNISSFRFIIMNFRVRKWSTYWVLSSFIHHYYFMSIFRKVATLGVLLYFLGQWTLWYTHEASLVSVSDTNSKNLQACVKN